MNLLKILSKGLHGAHLDEVSLQDRIAQSLTEAGLKFEREYILSPRERVDFYIPELLTGIEVKVAGSADSLNRQLGRYAASDKIERLIAVTTKRTHAALLPRRIGGKPFEVVIIERGLC